MRVLVVEDDRKIGSFVSKALQQAGYTVDHASDGLDGLHLALNNPYSAAVIDIMLPGMDGLDLIEELRRRNLNTPILILSAKRSVDDRVTGLQRGSDDYLTKPFALAELLARIEALLRRSSPLPSTRMVVGDLALDIRSRKVSRGDRRIDLQPKEFALLEYLMRNSGRPVSKMMILEQIWGYDFDPQNNPVDVLVCRLRNKVDRDFSTKLIKTLRGLGYVLESH
jgi:two-component system, OmpR family, response regulator